MSVASLTKSGLRLLCSGLFLLTFNACDSGETQSTLESSCSPLCEDRICGDDGCGGTCGECDTGASCQDNGTSCCTPACDGKTCGDDGCGGSCGTCATGEQCTVDGACLAGGSDEEEEEVVSCNAILQTGCEEGQNCTYAGADEEEPSCISAGDIPIGDACRSTSDCMEGICISLNDTESLCYEFCKTVGHCTGLVECLELESAPYNVCKVDDIYENCTLMDPAGCENAKACYLIDGESSPVCLPEGSASQGDECDGPGDCSGGHACINHRCLTLCNQNVTDSCGEFVACSTHYGNIGYCDEG